MMKKEKEFFERLIELVKDDKELHDATIRMMDAFSDGEKAKAEYYRRKKA